MKPKDRRRPPNAGGEKLTILFSWTNIKTSTPPRTGSFRALSRDHPDANRFLVGDVETKYLSLSTGRPEDFSDGYARTWRDQAGQTISSTENFRSVMSLLDFENSVFELLMHDETGGVVNDAGEKLKLGAPETRGIFQHHEKDPGPRTELLLRFKRGSAMRTKPVMNPVRDDPAGLAENGKRGTFAGIAAKAIKTGTTQDAGDQQEKTLRAVRMARHGHFVGSAPAERSEIYGAKGILMPPTCRWSSNAMDFTTAGRFSIY